MNGWRTCGFALCVVIILPIVLGFMWPSGTVTEDVWEVEQGIDITDSLNNREIDVWDYYRGPLNNLSIYRQVTNELTFPLATTTDVPNNYPIAAIESVATVQSVDFSTLALSGKSRFVISDGEFTMSGDATVWDQADYWPNTNTLILTQFSTDLGPDIMKTVSPKAGDQLTGTDLKLTTFGAPTGYIDLKKGLTGSFSTAGWTNELRNRSVEMWVMMNDVDYSNVIIGDVTVTRSSSGLISVAYGGTTEALGSAYQVVSLVFGMDGIEVRGLMGPEDFGATTYTIGNTIKFDAPRTHEIQVIGMYGNNYHWWVKQTMTAISTTKGISDSSIVPDSYYPTHSWELQIVNPATFGKSLTIAGINYPVTNGTIEVTGLPNIDPETGTDNTIHATLAVRGLRILSLVLDGQQEISVGGVTVLRQTPQSVTVSMDGQWYSSVVLSKVNQSEVTNYVYTPGSFNFSKSAYCIVGILACAAVAVGGSLWNKNKDSTIPLYIAMGCAGACYLIAMG